MIGVRVCETRRRNATNAVHVFACLAFFIWDDVPDKRADSPKRDRPLELIRIEKRRLGRVVEW